MSMKTFMNDKLLLFCCSIHDHDILLYLFVNIDRIDMIKMIIFMFKILDSCKIFMDLANWSELIK